MYGHVYRHAYRHVWKHVCRHVCRHVCQEFSYRMGMCIETGSGRLASKRRRHGPSPWPFAMALRHGPSPWPFTISHCLLPMCEDMHAGMERRHVSIDGWALGMFVLHRHLKPLLLDLSFKYALERRLVDRNERRCHECHNRRRSPVVLPNKPMGLCLWANKPMGLSPPMPGGNRS